jgi:hypothetical protein
LNLQENTRSVAFVDLDQAQHDPFRRQMTLRAPIIRGERRHLHPAATCGMGDRTNGHHGAKEEDHVSAVPLIQIKAAQCWLFSLLAASTSKNDRGVRGARTPTKIRRHNHADCVDADVALRCDGRPEISNSGAAGVGTERSILDASLMIWLAGHRT